MRTWYGKKYGKSHLTKVKKNIVKDDFTNGFLAGSVASTQWKSQPNPPKVYVFGNRVHHGLIGLALATIGYYCNKPYLTGYGTSLVLDDIDDMSHWFNFENNVIKTESNSLTFQYHTNYNSLNQNIVF